MLFSMAFVWKVAQQNYCCHCSWALGLLMGGFSNATWGMVQIAENHSQEFTPATWSGFWSSSKSLVTGSSPSFYLPWISSDLSSVQIHIGSLCYPDGIGSLFHLGSLVALESPSSAAPRYISKLIASAWKTKAFPHPEIDQSVNSTQSSISIVTTMMSSDAGMRIRWGPWSWCWTGKPDFWPTLGQV